MAIVCKNTNLMKSILKKLSGIFFSESTIVMLSLKVQGVLYTSNSSVGPVHLSFVRNN